MKGILSASLFLFLISLLLSPCQGLSPLKWTREVDLDENVHIKWVATDPDWLIMQVSTYARGYVAIGFSPNGAMKGADIVMGWIDDSGKGQLKDLYAEGNQTPMVDPNSDYELLGYEESDRDGKMTLRFRRKWNTCDYDNDFIIKEETTRLIWAWSDIKPGNSRQFKPTKHEPENRGAKSVYLKIPSLHHAIPDDNNLPSHIKYWDVGMKNNQVDNEHTTYFCQIFKVPKLRKKHHMIGFKPKLDPISGKYVHHMLMYGCKVDDKDGGTQAIFEKHVRSEGGRCYTANMPPEWNRYCFAASVIFAVGHEGEMYPEQTGFPLGEEFGGTTYYLLEVHYDNPHKQAFVDNSAVRIYYTDKLRKYDTEVLWTGTKVSPFHMIPPGQPAFTTKGFCSRECSEKTFPKEGMTVYQVFLHGHESLKEIIVRHIRNGKELQPISHDRHYDFNYQQVKLLTKPVKIMPGDEIITECTYNTEEFEFPIYGGLSTREEMCLAFLYYYPKTNVIDCRTDMEFTNFFDGLGIHKVTGDVLKSLNMPYKPTPNQESDPPDNSQLLQNSTETRLYNSFDLMNIADQGPHKGETVGDYLRNLEWTRNKKMAKKLNNDWNNGKYYQYCTAQGRKRHPLLDYIIRFPKYKPWIDPEVTKCEKDRSTTRRKTTRAPSKTSYTTSAPQTVTNRPFMNFLRTLFPNLYRRFRGE